MEAEIKKLQGTWRFSTLEVEANEVPEEMFSDSRMVIEGASFVMTSKEATYSGTFTVDVSKRPKTIDLFFTGGPEKGNTSLGIYELEEGTWRICLGFAGRDRPTAFVTTPGSGHALETLVRQGA